MGQDFWCNIGHLISGVDLLLNLNTSVLNVGAAAPGDGEDNILRFHCSHPGPEHDL